MDIELSMYCAADAWVIDHVDEDTRRRLTIKPRRVKVHRSEFGSSSRRIVSWTVYIEGAVIRQKDGEMTTHRRSIGYAYPGEKAGYLTPLHGVDRIDPEILSFADQARRMIEAAVVAGASS